jgi:hypothetical protein
VLLVLLVRAVQSSGVAFNGGGGGDGGEETTSVDQSTQ